MSNIRKNAKPEWFEFGQKQCVNCGGMFHNGDRILNGIFCPACGAKKEVELRALKRVAIWWDFHDACVKCAKEFLKGERVLFGLYCEKCGKKWIKERKLKQNRLKKARNL